MSRLSTLTYVVSLLLLLPLFGNVAVGQTELKSYHSEEYGYTIEYPASHEVEKRSWPTGKFPDQERVRFQGPGFAMMVAASRSEKLQGVPNEKLLSMMKGNRKAMERALRQAPRDRISLQSISSIEIDGRKALLLEGKEINRDLLTKMAYFKEGDTLYQIVVRTSPSGWSAHKEVIWDILTGFQTP